MEAASPGPEFCAADHDSRDSDIYVRRRTTNTSIRKRDNRTPSELVAEEKTRPLGHFWNRRMYNLTGYVRYLFNDLDVEGLTAHYHDEGNHGSHTLRHSSVETDVDHQHQNLTNVSQISLDDKTAACEAWTPADGKWDDVFKTPYLLLCRPSDENGRINFDVTDLSTSGTVATYTVGHYGDCLLGWRYEGFADRPPG